MTQAIWKCKNLDELLWRIERTSKLLKSNPKLAYDTKIVYNNDRELPEITLTFNILVNKNDNTKESTDNNK